MASGRGRCKKLDRASGAEFVHLAFGRPVVSSETIDEFRHAFKKRDVAFPMTGNDHELAVLSGCALAAAMLTDGEIGAQVGTYVLAASACGKRNPAVAIDLLGMASHVVAVAAMELRRRPPLVELKLPGDPKQTIDEAIKALEESAEGPNIIRAIREIATQSTNQSAPARKVMRAVEQMKSVITIQDEELQILWWLIGGWSREFEVSFKDLPADAKPVILAKEMADMTAREVEPPALRALFSKAGIASGKRLTIPSAVNACGDDRLKVLMPSSMPCATLTPVHTAVSKAVETGCGDAWVAGWSAASGFPADAKVNALDLALQVHRERLFLATF